MHMKKFIQSWLGIPEIQNQLTELQTRDRDLDRKLDREASDWNADRSSWRIAWARLNALIDYLNLREEQHQIPDLNYIPQDQKTHTVYRYEPRDKKQKTPPKRG